MDDDFKIQLLKFKPPLSNEQIEEIVRIHERLVAEAVEKAKSP